MIKSKAELAEKIVDEMIDLDLLNTIDYDTTNAKFDVIDIIKRNLCGYLIIQGDVMPMEVENND